MDRQFLELWGTMLLNAAKGQKQLEDFSKLMRGDFSSFDDMAEMLGNIYGIGFFKKNAPDYLDIWEKAMQDFNTAFKDFIAMMDLVPRSDYLELLRENEDLKKKAALQEENISDLQKILDKQLSDQEEGLKGFESLIQNQDDQFRKLMNNFSNMLSSSVSGAAASREKSTTTGNKSPKSKKASSDVKAKAARGKKA
ncbi:MAG: hypothetical protein JW896_18370 [Deltaproteobacteria bacterium]|nr:hypothetical protein [Deltaproteobacteria bacterium]